MQKLLLESHEEKHMRLFKIPSDVNLQNRNKRLAAEIKKNKLETVHHQSGPFTRLRNNISKVK